MINDLPSKFIVPEFKISADPLRDVERKKLGSNPLADAISYDIEKNRPNADASLEEFIDFEVKSRAKHKASIALAHTAYQSVRDPKFALTNKWIADTLNIDVGNINKKNYSSLATQAIQVNFNNIIAEHGTLPNEVMTDPNFRNYISADEYKYLTTLRDLDETAKGRDGIFNSIGRAWDLSKAEYDRDLAFANNLTAEGAQQSNKTAYANTYLYRRDRDGTLFDAFTVLSDQFTPYRDNPVLMAVPVLSTVLGARMGGDKGAQFGLVAGDALATYNQRYEQQLARDLLRVYNENPNIDLEQAKSILQDEVHMAVGLDYVSNLAGVALGSKITGALKRLGSTVKDGQKVETARTAGQRVGQALQSAFKDFGIAWTAEVATEGVQGAVSQKGVDEALGKDFDLDRVITSGLKEASEAMSVMAVIAGTGATIKGLADFGSMSMTDINYAQVKQAEQSIEAIKDLAERATMAEVNSLNDLNIQQPKALNSILRKLNRHDSYIKASVLDNYITANEIDRTKLDEIYSNLSEDARVDPDKLYKIPEADIYTVLHSPNYTELLLNSKRTVDGITPNEAKDFKDSINIDDFIQAIKDRKARTQDEQIIKADIFNTLSQSDNSLTPEQMDGIAQFTADNYRAMADILGMDIKKLYDLEHISITPIEGKHHIEGDDLLSDVFAPHVDGTFKPREMSVNLKDRSTFSTALHEMAHAFLQLSSNLHARLEADIDNTLDISPESRQKFNELWQGLKDGLQMPKEDIYTLGQLSVKAHEVFVNTFLKAITDPNVTLPFKPAFKRWIIQHIKRQVGIRGNGTISYDQINDYFDRHIGLYGYNGIEIKENFVNFVNAISTVNDIKQDEDMPDNKSAFSSLLANPNLDDEGRKAIAELEQGWIDLEQDLQKENNNIEKLLYELNPRILKNMAEVQEYFKHIKKTLDTTNPNLSIMDLDVRYEELTAKILGGINNRLNSPRAQATVLYQLDRAEADKYLTADEVALLDSKGRLSDNGLSLEQINSEVYKNKSVGAKTIAYDLFYTSLNESELAQYVHNKVVPKLHKELETQLKRIQKFRDYRVKKRIQLGRKEHTLFNRLTNRGKEGTEYIKALAVLDISNTTFDDLDFRQYATQANQYRKQMLKHLSLGQIQEAAVAKQKEMLYLYKSEYASKVSHEFKQQAKDFVKLFKSKALSLNDKGNLKYDFALSTIAKEILIRSGFLKTSPTHRDNLEYAMTTEQGKFKIFGGMLKTNIPYYKNMTVEDLARVLDELARLKSNASYLKRTELAEGKHTIATIRDELIGVIKENVRLGIDKRKDVEGYANVDKMTFIDGMFSVMGKMGSVCKFLDGRENGAFSKYIYRPVRRAVDYYLYNLAQYRKASTAIIKEYGQHIRHKKNGIIRTKQWLGFDLGLSSETRGNGLIELLGILSHMGNDENRHALMLSLQNYNPDLDQSTLDNFFQAMIEEGWIDQKMMDTVQALWNLNSTVFVKAQETYRKLNGKPMVKVQAKKLVTPWGEYTGGYMPLLREKNATQAKVFEVLDLEDFGKQVEGTIGSNDPNFLATRTGWNGNSAVVIDIQALIRHGEKVIRYSQLQPALSDVKKVIDSHAFSTVLDNYHPKMRENLFGRWLKAVANDQRTERPDHMVALYNFLNYIKKMTSGMLMGFNINNTVQGLSQLAALKTTTKSQYIVGASESLFLSPSATLEFVLGKSVFMRVRAEENIENVDLMFQKNFIIPTAKGFNFKTFEQWWKYDHVIVMDKVYFLQQMLQRRLDLIAWKSKYDQCIAEGMTEQDAIALADDNVRETSTSFDVVDSSAIERGGPWVQLMTQFMPYFITMANLAMSRGGIATKSALLNNKSKLIVCLSYLPVGFFSIVLPAILAEVINKTFTQTWEEEEEDAILNPVQDALLGAPLRMGFAMVPLFGTMGLQVFNETLLDKHYYTDSNFNMPSVTIARQAFGQITSMAKDVDEGWDHKDSRDLAYLLSLITGNPFVAPVGKSVGVMADIIDGTIQPKNEWDWLMSVLQAKPSKDSQK